MNDMIAVRHSLPGRSIKVYCIADVHIGDALCDMDGIRALVRKIENDRDSYCVLCGDLFNNAVIGSPSDVYGELMTPQEQLNAGVKLLSPIKDKILGVVGGNHEARTKKQTGIDLTAVLCTLLGIEDRYRENMCFVMVELRNNAIHHTYNLLLMHGKSENRKKQFAYSLENVDALVTGHTHSGLVQRPARLCLSPQGNVHVKPLVSITACSWLKYGGYGATAMYNPVETSCPSYLVLNYFNTNSKESKITVVW